MHPTNPTGPCNALVCASQVPTCRAQPPAGGGGVAERHGMRTAAQPPSPLQGGGLAACAEQGRPGKDRSASAALLVLNGNAKERAGDREQTTNACSGIFPGSSTASAGAGLAQGGGCRAGRPHLELCSLRLCVLQTGGSALALRPGACLTHPVLRRMAVSWPQRNDEKESIGPNQDPIRRTYLVVYRILSVLVRVS